MHHDEVFHGVEDFHPVLVGLGDARERGREAAAVVPESQAEDGEHRQKEHTRGERRLHGIVAGIDGELGSGGGFGGDAG